jgi:hypothetical protein
LLAFAIPLIKPAIGTSNRPITDMKQKNLKIYGYNNVSPEIIWQYGEKIPSIQLKDGAFIIPDESQFGVLGYNLSEKDWGKLQSIYTIKKVDRFDLNTIPKDSKRYNDRIINDFYILTRN